MATSLSQTTVISSAPAAASEADDHNEGQHRRLCQRYGNVARGCAGAITHIRDCTDAGSVGPLRANRVSRGMLWVEVRLCREVVSQGLIWSTRGVGGLCGFWSAWWPPPASSSA